jgi:hypothetical protein
LDYSHEVLELWPSLDTKLLIEKLKLPLPSQPPPRLTAQKENNEIEEIEVQNDPIGGSFVVKAFQ